MLLALLMFGEFPTLLILSGVKRRLAVDAQLAEQRESVRLSCWTRSNSGEIRERFKAVHPLLFGGVWRSRTVLHRLAGSSFTIGFNEVGIFFYQYSFVQKAIRNAAGDIF